MLPDYCLGFHTANVLYGGKRYSLYISTYSSVFKMIEAWKDFD